MAKQNRKPKAVSIKDSAYTNAMTGLGMMATDKTTHTRPNSLNLVQNDDELAMMYIQDGIATTIADIFPETALADDIAITGDTDGKILKDLEAIGFSEAVIEAGSMARLFGGSAILTLYDGSSPFYSKPKPTEKIIGYKVYSCADFDIGNNDYVTDYSSEYYNEIELFNLNLENGKRIKIHESRLTIFRNKKAPRNLKTISFKQKYFGCSSVKEVDDSLKDLGSTMSSVANMASENGVKVFSLEGLTDILSRPDGGVPKLQERMNVINMLMSSFRTIFQDKLDEFKMVSHNFAGIPDIIRLMMVVACAKSRIPMSILFGQSITGLSGTNDGDLKTFYADVNGWRKKVLYRPMCELITEYMNRNERKAGNHDFTFAPIGALTGKEYIDAKKVQADTCEKFFNMGAMTSSEIRKCALENGGTFELSVHGDNPEENDFSSDESED